MNGEPLRAMVARAARGDEIAFARIVAEHHDDMARVAYVMCGEVDLAQEAVQSAWTKAWTRLDTIREADRLKPWLVSIAANEAKQLVRSRSRRRVREIPMPESPADGPEPFATNRIGSDPADRVVDLDLAAALMTLDDTDRTLVALRYAAGLTSDEIGRVIGMTGGGVRARLARLLDRLRRELHDDDPA
ncbi:MAG TPA: RNA polymerase sigma factor [Candidatus Limnocylindrales bacterium]|nr:RNA polymerase sigma factor [Candidatus Limnocylindrales bacterium]